MHPEIRISRPRATTRKNSILLAACEIFREKGYAASTVREIATKSGIEAGSLYYHFSSKQEILLEIMDTTMANLLEGITGAIKNETDCRSKLKAAIRFHLRYHIDHVDETRVTDEELRSLTPSNYKLIVAKRRQYENIFVQILREGTEHRVMNIHNTRLTAFAILSMCTGVYYWFRPDGVLSIDEVAEEYCEFILWGVSGQRGAESVFLEGTG